MPVYKEISSGIREKHTAERLQVPLKTSGENVADMRPEVFFEIQIETSEGVALGAPSFDGIPLILNPAEDPELAEAIALIQQKIGEARYLQLHTPSS